MIWTDFAFGTVLRTCPLAGGPVILLCLFMHALGVNMGWVAAINVGLQEEQYGVAAASGVPLSDRCV